MGIDLEAETVICVSLITQKVNKHLYSTNAP